LYISVIDLCSKTYRKLNEFIDKREVDRAYTEKL
jgi:hypothetical protein